MKKLIYTISAMAFAMSTMAQSAPNATPAGEKTRRFSIGTSLTPIFLGNPQLGVQLKYNNMSGTGATRLYVSYSGSTNNDDVTKDETTMQDFKANLGYEWHKMEGKFTLLYGADLVLDTHEHRIENNTKSTYTSATDLGFGLKIFIGASYRINSRFSVATEIGKRIVGTESRNYSDKNTYIKTTGVINDYVTSQILTINYHF